jgi:hypothetical protein
VLYGCVTAAIRNSTNPPVAKSLRPAQGAW